MKLEATVEDVVRSRFTNTISQLKAEVQEAQHRIYTDMDYTPLGVYERMKKLQDIFMKELTTLVKQIEI